MFKFEDYFSGYEQVLLAELALIRAKLSHAGNKGVLAEIALRRFLTSHLPRNNEVGHGEAVDTHGTRVGELGGPGQLDVLVVNDNQPRFGIIDDPSLYFLENVLCGGEVKSQLTSGDLIGAVKKASEFKKLEPHIPAGVQTWSRPLQDMDRFVHQRPFFLFAFESQMTLKAVSEKIEAIGVEQQLEPTAHVDGIFILGRGSSINFGNGQGELQSISSETGKSIVGWALDEENVLLQMIGWLHIVMPNLVYPKSILPTYLLPTVDELKSRPN